MLTDSVVGVPSLGEQSQITDPSAGNAERISIAFVNNMPDTAIRSSERQFYGLLKSASGIIDIDVTGYACMDVPRSDSARETLRKHYRDAEELFEGRVDGLIVTGAEPSSWTPH